MIEDFPVINVCQLVFVDLYFHSQIYRISGFECPEYDLIIIHVFEVEPGFDFGQIRRVTNHEMLLVQLVFDVRYFCVVITLEEDFFRFKNVHLYAVYSFKFQIHHFN